MPPEARHRALRTTDALRRFEQDVDAWVATASASGGEPYQIPLSYLWDGETFLISTPIRSITGRNLIDTGRVQLGIGPTRDVVLVRGQAEPVPAEQLPGTVAEAFAAKTGFDPREYGDRYLYFRIRPVQIRAWREENELAGRDLMVDGRWLERQPAVPNRAAPNPAAPNRAAPNPATDR